MNTESKLEAEIYNESGEIAEELFINVNNFEHDAVEVKHTIHIEQE